MTYQLRFGSYDFPSTFSVAEMPSNRVVPLLKLPRADGARALRGYFDGKRIKLRGGFTSSGIANCSNVRDALDALKLALAAGPANFTTESDRFFRNCQAENYADSYDPADWGRIVMVSFDLVAGDPYAYDVTPVTVNLVTTSGVVASVGGNARPAPQISLTMGTTGPCSFLVTNTTSGESFTLAGTVASGDVIVIDSLEEIVTISGVDRMDLFDGTWLSLLAGASNTITVTITTGTITARSLTYNNRWYS